MSTTPQNSTNTKHDTLNNDFLFTEFPQEINQIILNQLDLKTLFATSSACKRWMNNTSFVENLRLNLTKKAIFKTGEVSYRRGHAPTLAKIDWRPMEATLKKFDPKRLRSLCLTPDLHQKNAIVDDFVSRATNLQVLTLNSTHYMDAVLTLPQGTLKKLILGTGQFDERVAHFTNLEKLQFTVKHSRYNRLELDQIRKFKKLESLTIHGAAEPYISWDLIADLDHLKELKLHHAYIPDDRFGVFSKLTNLEKLSLRSLSKEIPTDEEQFQIQMAIIPKLGNANPVSGLRHLTNLVNLTYLDVSNIQRNFAMFRNQVAAEEGYDLADLIEKHWTKLKTIKISSTKLGRENRNKLRAMDGLTVVDEIDSFGNGDDDMDSDEEEEMLARALAEQNEQ